MMSGKVSRLFFLAQAERKSPAQGESYERTLKSDEGVQPSFELVAQVELWVIVWPT